MQSSISPDPPRLDIPGLSNDSVLVSKEVPIAPSLAPTPPAQRSTTSTLPPGHVQRPQSSNSLLVNSSTVQVARWKSVSKSSEKSSIFQRAGMGPRPSSMDHELLESNRESMKALAEFLMTRQPPPTNWISNQSSDDEESLSAFKRSAHKILGRSQKKNRKTPKLMQLPDSAVSAKTSKGARHIAISIPLIHDLMATRPDSPIPLKPEKKDGQRERTDRSAVHVLKPLNEVRESASGYLASPPRSRNGPLAMAKNINELDINPLASNPPDEAHRQSPTLGESKGTYLNYRLRARTEPSNAPKYDPKRTPRSYVAVSPTALQRQDSQRSDPRHSGGTVYSTISLATPQVGHSRQTSSVSTAPSATAVHATVISALKIDLPPRNSSISKVPKSIEAELALAAAKIKKRESGNPLRPSTPNTPVKHGSESMISGTPSNSPLPAVLATASTARKYSGAALDGPVLVRSNTPRSPGPISPQPPSPPPNKSLPDIPVGAAVDKGPPRPRTTPTSQGVEKGVSPNRTSSVGGREGAPRSSRHERVKERKQRDIAALRSSRAPLGESTATQETHRDSVMFPTVERTTTTIPPRHPKRSGTLSIERRRLANSVSPIMLVADLPPHHIFLPFHQYSKKSSSSTIRAPPHIKTSNLEVKQSERGQQTSPHSPLTPLPSDFPNIPTHYSSRHSLTASSKYRSGSALSSGSSHNPANSSYPSQDEELENGGEEEYHFSTNTNTTRSPRQSLRTSILSTRRAERRTKRNLSLREQELDARLEKIERDNAVLLQTLGLVSRSFGVLGRNMNMNRGSGSGSGSGFSSSELGKEKREGRNGVDGLERERERDSGGFEESEREKERRGELRGMEPFMWELQGAAPRVSEEIGGWR